MPSFSSVFNVTFNNPNATADFARRTVGSHSPSDIHLLIQHRTSREIDSRSAHGGLVWCRYRREKGIGLAW